MVNFKDQGSNLKLNSRKVFFKSATNLYNHVWTNKYEIKQMLTLFLTHVLDENQGKENV